MVFWLVCNNSAYFLASVGYLVILALKLLLLDSRSVKVRRGPSSTLFPSALLALCCSTNSVIPFMKWNWGCAFSLICTCSWIRPFSSLKFAYKVECILVVLLLIGGWDVDKC